MQKIYIGLTLAISAVLAGSPLLAQQDSGAGDTSTAVEALAKAPATADPAAVVPETVYKTAADGSVCELHVWPTENYIGINTGILSGFGIVGALADVAAHEGRVKTVKDLMKDYLGPEIQKEELTKLGINETLKLDGYKIIWQEPTPFNEDAKDNPELKAKIKAMNAKIKGKQRLSDSTAPCYAELTTTHIFYHKAMMYGSNLFTGWIYREFDGPKQTKVGKGQVKNPLENFPPKTEDMIEPAKLELRDAYAKDFTEYVQKKVFRAR
ncbi:hypothetical protein [Sphingorhabdus sp. SMR4y]|uniref:hypothetical protein n=1 Tax=Sphingorhabdus sp. SMR4y TaxID=2584094 RepID=UPI000B5CF0A0|nr:hypothetical protein [Sphingorhabdus sp. SMR4y]ASK90132.1 hypothetical protein SPHFLASMR4Y_03406 [Sphingorhabdus sp. SMR4y]